MVNLLLNSGGTLLNGKPITYLTAWELVGNSSVQGTEIWSCGELSATDNKYHIYISSNGRVFDIALTEPLRKVNDVADKIDFEDGVATVTRYLGFIYMGDKEWKIYTTGSGQRRNYTTLSTIKVPLNNSIVPNIICIGYESSPYNNLYAQGDYDNIICVSSNKYLFVRDSVYNELEASEFTAHVRNFELLYELETPTTETVEVPQIEVSSTDTYTQVISQGAKAVAWTEFETDPEALFAYGVQWDKNDSNPDVTRIGNMALHASLPVQSQMRGCLLDDDGNVTKYLNTSDWTSETRDGSQGQVMVEIPHFYWKFAEDENGIQSVMISLQPLNGYTEVWHSPMYVSAYQAALDRTNNKLASVVNTSTQYRGGNNMSTWDEDSQKTLLGKPVTSINLTNFRTYARNRKANSVEWNCNTYLMQKVLYWLFVVEYATRNTQKAYDNTLTTEGYKKGGLGAGVTNVNDTVWNSYSSRNPFVPCGHTDSLGNGTGQVSIVMPLGANGADITIYVPRYRGIENPFGHILQWTDGVLVNVQPGDDGESQCYVTTNPSNFSSSSYSDYTYIGTEPRASGYIKDVLFGTDGDILAKTRQTKSPSDTKYYCDYHYVYIPASSALRAVAFGGRSNAGGAVGLVVSDSSNIPSSASSLIGSRLNFLPATE